MKDESTKNYGIEAVILDLDGVITQTAKTHQAAWAKMFNEFLAKQEGKKKASHPMTDEDYKKYLDGKPRYVGAASFIASRNIHLPHGDPDDDPEKETVCGLGNRKNNLFHKILKKGGVEIYQDAVHQIKNWREHHLKIAVVSSSKNCKLILESAGISNLFDTIVDGLLAEEIGLKGKPSPDIFLEAADRLQVNPSSSIVIEDAIAGVQAGDKGGFAYVAGVCRNGNKTMLLKHGADVVVESLDELNLFDNPEIDSYFSQPIPWIFEEQSNFNELISGKTPVIFLDYDGTLTPIVKNPEDAVLSNEMRDTLNKLADFCRVAVVSGRDMDDVKNLVGLDNIIYAGSHGYRISGPEGLTMEFEEAKKLLPVLDEIEEKLKKKLEGKVEGVKIDRKRYAVAVHYRNTPPEQVSSVKKTIDQILQDYKEFKKGKGKKVIEIKPGFDWHKGKALFWILDALKLSQKEEILPIYIGDDVTDEDAFKALTKKGIGIQVGTHGEQTAAIYRLRNVYQVRNLLKCIPKACKVEKPAASPEQWIIKYAGWKPEEQHLREALCALGNGYFVTRGAAEEVPENDYNYPGTYIANGYNRLKSSIAGRDIENEDLVNWPNWLYLSFKHENGEWFDLEKVDVLEYNQNLNLKTGVLERKMRFKDRNNHETLIISQRIVSMADANVAGIQWSLIPLNWSGKIIVRSGIDGNVTNNGVKRYRELRGDHLDVLKAGGIDEESFYLLSRTKQSKIRMALGARTRIYINDHPKKVEQKTYRHGNFIARDLEIDCAKLQMIKIEKLVTIYSSKEAAISDPFTEVKTRIHQPESFNILLKKHIRKWELIWKRCDINMKTKHQNQLILRLHIFHLFQTISENSIDLDVGLPSRGWHGEAYRGHIFWDELYIFPFLNLHVPQITRALLMYRYRRLPQAVYEAGKAGYKGAMYPWQSGSNGREESQQYHLNPQSGRWIPDHSKLQRHINAAIAYNVWQYFQCTNDMEFLTSYGAEMILSIALFWSSIAEYNPRSDRYEIRGVMGPDEYHEKYPGSDSPGLNNNAYTNFMAVWVIQCALNLLKMFDKEYIQDLSEKINLEEEDLKKWEEMTRKMYIPFHDGNIITQFDGFDQLEDLDWPAYRKKYGENIRLDRVLESENDTPNRYKASKQADVLMLFYLFSAQELVKIFHQLGYDFSADSIPKNIEYYDKITSNGSTLSQVVHSWVYTRSDRKRSWDNFEKALLSDFKDVQGGTTPEGIHLGAMAGTIDLIQRCYTGLEIRDNVLWFRPYLPENIQSMTFYLRYRSHWIKLNMNHKKLRIDFDKGWAEPVDIGVYDQVIRFETNDYKEFDIMTS